MKSRKTSKVNLVTEQPSLICSDKVAIKNEFGEIQEIEPEIGDTVKTDNISGQLLCSSKAGVNSLDLFNHVLTEGNICQKSDLRKALFDLF